jgi:DnaJ-domain-containing protein 1
MGHMRKYGWTIKQIKPGMFYLYTWEFDAAGTIRKREEMVEHMKNGNEKGYTKRDLGTKASRYKWHSLGRLDFENPEKHNKKLNLFLVENMNQLDAIKERYFALKAKNEAKKLAAV